MLVQVGQGHIVAEQKRQALVVVFEIQRFPQALGQLVDEAEHAVVCAGMLLVDQIGLEFTAQRLVFALFHLQVIQLAILHHGQLKAFAGGVELVIQHIVDFVAVSRIKHRPGAQAQRFGCRAFLHAFHAYCHASFAPSFSTGFALHKKKGKA